MKMLLSRTFLPAWQMAWKHKKTELLCWFLVVCSFIASLNCSHCVYFCETRLFLYNVHPTISSHSTLSPYFILAQQRFLCFQNLKHTIQPRKRKAQTYTLYVSLFHLSLCKPKADPEQRAHFFRFFLFVVRPWNNEMSGVATFEPYHIDQRYRKRNAQR